MRARKQRRGRVSDPASVPSGLYINASEARVRGETRWLGGTGVACGLGGVGRLGE